MHTAEEVRVLARVVAGEYAGDTLPVTEALRAYADLLEAMEEFEYVSSQNTDQEVVRVMLRPVEIIRQRADEKQKARKG